MNRAEIKANVLRVIDEISPFDNIDIIWDTLIEQTIDEVAKRLLLNYPIHLLPSKQLNITTFYNTEDGWGTLNLPSDFLKLSAFKFVSWRRSVHEAITEEDPRYYQQKNKYSRAGVARPVCALVGDKVTILSIPDYAYYQTVLELYPVYYDWDSSEIEKALYIGTLLPEQLPTHLLEPFFWLAGSQVLITMEKNDFAQICMAKYQEYIALNSPKPLYP